MSAQPRTHASKLIKEKKLVWNPWIPIEAAYQFGGNRAVAGVLWTRTKVVVSQMGHRIAFKTKKF